MFVFNGIIFLAGAAILGVGIWVKVDSGSILNYLHMVEDSPMDFSQVLNIGYLMIAIGAFLLVVGFLGCCGAVRENKCMLLMFFIIVLIIFIAEVAGAVVILVFKPVAKDLFTIVGQAAVLNIKKDYGENSDITGLWDSTMDTLKCCGFFNASDFVDSPYYVSNGHQYPTQCCRNMNPCNQTHIHVPSTVPGCFKMIKHLVDDNIVVIIAVALSIAILELSSMTVSMILYCKIES